ncbi:MAG: VWA domain-containing protein [Bacteroidetes bacterium]|nr:MAG: VWA domain-containing protein [Bacteroidota bacterium]
MLSKKHKRLAVSFLFAAILVWLGLFFQSCATKPIEVKSFTGYIQVEEGESADVQWEFANADRVQIKGLNYNFSPNDSYKIKPTGTKIVQVIAYKGDDSLAVNAVIDIAKKKVKPQYGRGPTMDFIGLSPAYLESDYLAGVIKADTTMSPYQIKIMRTVYPYTKDQFLVRALVLDRFGNYMSGLSSLPGEINWSAALQSDLITSNYDVTTFNEKDYSTSEGIDINILLDNSSAATRNDKVIDAIRSFLPYLTKTDKISFSYFNQTKTEVFPLTNPTDASKEFEKVTLGQPQGLNSIYKCAYTSVSPFASGSKRNKLLVILTYGSDNSSIIYSSNDVGKLAHDLDIPVYIIGVGSAMESYSLKYLCSLTGGRYYQVINDEISKIENILLEISFSQKGYYELLMPVYSSQLEQNMIKSVLTYQRGKTKLTDRANIILKPEMQFSQYQALAYFGYRDTVIQTDFDVIFKSLAKVLKDNPNSVIQLVGHSSTEGTNEYNLDLSLKRAQEARRKLIGMGAAPSQIRIRGEGNAKPIYYLQSTQWQQQNNRRVTVRWLDPSILPYEIIAGESNTENDALAKVEQWEGKKYQVYYERYIENNIPVYKIKLWGYATQKDAEDTAKHLKEKFKSDFAVE